MTSTDNAMYTLGQGTLLTYHKSGVSHKKADGCGMKSLYSGMLLSTVWQILSDFSDVFTVSIIRAVSSISTRLYDAAFRKTVMIKLIAVKN
jgi:hypothetical protein